MVSNFKIDVTSTLAVNLRKVTLQISPHLKNVAKLPQHMFKILTNHSLQSLQQHSNERPAGIISNMPKASKIEMKVVCWLVSLKWTGIRPILSDWIA